MFYMWILLLLLGVKPTVVVVELKGVVPNSARTVSVTRWAYLMLRRPNQKPNSYG